MIGNQECEGLIDTPTLPQNNLPVIFRIDTDRNGKESKLNYKGYRGNGIRVSEVSQEIKF